MRNHRNLLITIGVLVFLLGLTASYLLLGNKFPWAAGIWKKLTSVFPIPVATVEGYDVKNDLVEAARRLGIEDPMNFAVQQTAIKVLADRENVSVTSDEADAKEKALEANWKGEKLSDALDNAKVSKNDFRKLFIEPELYKEKLAVTRQVRTPTVDLVHTALKNGEDFAILARTHSDDPLTRAFSGDAGFVTAEKVYSSVWGEAKGLSLGEWAGPIATPDGYMFIKKLEEKSGTEIHLQAILIHTFDFGSWLKEQIEQMRVVVYI